MRITKQELNEIQQIAEEWGEKGTRPAFAFSVTVGPTHSIEKLMEVLHRVCKQNEWYLLDMDVVSETEDTTTWGVTILVAHAALPDVSHSISQPGAGLALMKTALRDSRNYQFNDDGEVCRIRWSKS